MPLPALPPALLRRARVTAAQLQRHLARALGVSWAHRTDTVVAMLANNARRAPGYWIQLVLAMGIATFGLVLGSTAVVIGAMLVSPLMGPIIELGMGFAVGSTLLVLRSALRSLLSIATVVGGAAVITLALPFHELNAEIAARTAPTALDLLVAVCCALTAAYTTVRAAADTTAAAAGTAIGIALVPPLCVVGYGLGTAAPAVAGGAALLFVANFSAIVGFAAVAFLLLGYNWVDSARLEREHLRHDRSETERAAERAYGVLHRLFGSRYGVAMRFGVPLLFIAVVYVPLSRALDEVTWQVRMRSVISRALADDAGGAVQTSVRVDRRQVALQLLLPGTPEAADSLERLLAGRLASAGAADPEVRVTAVADAGALAALARAQRSAAAAPPATVEELRRLIAQRLGARWPTDAAGPLLDWRAETPASGPMVVTTRHLGAPVGAAAEALLAAQLADVVRAPVRVTTVAIPAGPLVAPAGGEETWLAEVEPVLALVAATPAVSACVLAPAAPRGARAQRTAARLRQALDSSAAARAGRLRVDDGAAWSLRVVPGTCTDSAAPPPAAGAADAASPRR